MKSIISNAIVVLALLNNDQVADAKVKELIPHLRPKFDKARPQTQVAKKNKRNKMPMVEAVEHPKVCAGICEREYFFKDDNNEWYIVSSSPMLTSGWEWKQTTDTSKWVIEFQPYLET